MNCRSPVTSTLDKSCLTLNRHLLLEIRQQLQGLRDDVAEVKGLLVNLLENSNTPFDPLLAGSNIHLPEIPEEILTRFCDAMEIGAPKDFKGIAEFPLKEGFDALVYHFSQVMYFPIKGNHMRG